MVLPYLEATQSGIAQIAFGSDLPVITTRVGGLPETVRDEEFGLVVRPRDEEALAQAITRFFEEDLAGDFQDRIRAERDVFSWDRLVQLIEDVLEEAELGLEDVALIIPHQANKRIIEAAAKKLKVEPSRFYMNLNRYGNTSAASIPIALCDAVDDGLLKPDDNVVFVGFGGGLTWAATVVKWDVSPPEVSVVDREWTRARYMVARSRSRLRKFSRRLGARVLGSPTPDATMKDLKETSPLEEDPKTKEYASGARVLASDSNLEYRWTTATHKLIRLSQQIGRARFGDQPSLAERHCRTTRLSIDG